jgi:hypothetical protein
MQWRAPGEREEFSKLEVTNIEPCAGMLRAAGRRICKIGGEWAGEGESEIWIVIGEGWGTALRGRETDMPLNEKNRPRTRRPERRASMASARSICPYRMPDDADTLGACFRNPCLAHGRRKFFVPVDVTANPSPPSGGIEDFHLESVDILGGYRCRFCVWITDALMVDRAK